MMHIGRIARFFVVIGIIAADGRAFAQSVDAPTNINTIADDLVVPEAIDAPPAPGKRVREKNPGYEDWNLHHVVYLPPDWKPGEKYPVLVEYPGNGGYENKLGDRSTGRVEDCKLGFGISGGRGMIWVCLPFVNPQSREHQLNWWGDADATAAYCRQTVARVCREYGGDRERLVLCGFSRGAIACGYIGLRDDATAKLWRAIIAHSHYDGVRRWNYAEDDRDSARKRLARLHDRPQFVSHESSIDAVREYLDEAGIHNAMFLVLPYPNHTADWVLKDIPERKQLRDWLTDVLK